MHGGQWLHGALIKLSTSEHPQGQESALKMDDFHKNIPFTQSASSFNSFFVTQLDCGIIYPMKFFARLYVAAKVYILDSWDHAYGWYPD